MKINIVKINKLETIKGILIHELIHSLLKDNKKVLDFEFDRIKQGEWLKKAGVNTPKEFKDIKDVEFVK